MIKKFIIKNCMSIVKNNYPEYDQTQLEKIQYGLESIYLSTTKVVVIILLSILLGILKETLLVLLFFNLLRTTGFGLHASKSWSCWVSSIPTFIISPLICKYVNIPFFILIAIAIISIIFFIFFAPADTHKRPLIRRKKRIIYKIITILSGIIYLVFIILTKDMFLRNCLAISMLIEAILICPLTYKIFKLPYNNYKTYNQ